MSHQIDRRLSTIASLVVISIAFVIGGCDSVGTTWNDSSPARGSGPPDIILADDANSLSEETVGRLQSTPDSAGVLPERLVFDGSPGLDSVIAGEYIVSGRSEKAPLGFVRRVQEKRASEGQVVLETERVPPLEPYERLVIDTTVALTDGPAGAQSASKSSRLDQVSDKFLNGDGPIAKTITGFCSNSGDSLCAQASVGPLIYSLKIKPEASIDIRKTGEEKSVNLEVTFGRRAVYGIQVSNSLDYEVEKDEILISDKKFAAVSLGPIPVITFNLDAGFGASFEVSRTFSYLKKFKSPEGSGNGRTLGFDFEGGSARLINERRGGEATLKEARNFPDGLVDFVVGDPVLDNDVYGILAVDARLGETVGPRISFEPFARLQLRDFAPPPITWETYLGLRGEVEANVEPLGVDVAQVDLLEAEVQDPIASGTLPESSKGDFPPYIRPPRGIEGKSVGAKRKVTWDRIPGDDPSDETDVKYCLYAFDENFDSDDVEGDEEPNSIQKVRCESGTEIVHEVEPDNEYFGDPLVYRVTTAAQSGAGSKGSESIVLEGEIPSVKEVTAASKDSAVRLEWEEPDGSELLAGYMVYRDTEEFGEVKMPRYCSEFDDRCQADFVRQVVTAQRCEDNDGKYDCLIQNGRFIDDEEVENNKKYHYRVAPVVALDNVRFEGEVIPRLQGDDSEIVTATPLPEPPDRPKP